MVYVSDERYSIQSVPHRREWNLLIKDVQKKDGGVYECQISSRYKLIHHIMLTVNSTCLLVSCVVGLGLKVLVCHHIMLTVNSTCLLVSCVVGWGLKVLVCHHIMLTVNSTRLLISCVVGWGLKVLVCHHIMLTVLSLIHI